MKKGFLILLCVFGTLLASAQTYSFQVWTGLEASIDLSKRLSLDVGVESRFQQHSALLKQASAEVGARYSVTKPLFVGASYEFADKYRIQGYFPVHTFAALVGYKKKFGNFRVAIQTKMNVSKNTYIKNEKSLLPSFVDKNKLKVAYVANKRVRPSLFVETYHPLGAGTNYSIATVKYGANCSFGFRKQIGLDLGYMLRHEIQDDELISIVTLSIEKSF